MDEKDLEILKRFVRGEIEEPEFGIELSPCPFCGGAARLTGYIDELAAGTPFVHAECGSCGTCGPSIETGESGQSLYLAKLAWNTRV